MTYTELQLSTTIGKLKQQSERVGVNKATFLQRLVAYLVDMVILAIASSLLVALIFGLFVFFFGLTGRAEESWAAALAGGLSLLIILISLVLQFVYFGYFWSRQGRSIGMGGMNLRVENKDGTRLSFLMAGLRGTVGYYISSLVFYLGFLWMLFDAEQETWHDKIFGSRVMRN